VSYEYFNRSKTARFNGGEMKKRQYYKLARTNGWDFYSGKTINYRENIGRKVRCPSDVGGGFRLCSPDVIHACPDPNDCFAGASIPCSAYLVQGKPVCDDGKKFGFRELNVLGEIKDLNTLFGWNYDGAIKPINPLSGRGHKPKGIDIELLKQWASVRASVGASVGASVLDSVGDSVWDSVGASVWDSVGASVRAYMGSLFPNVPHWEYTKHKKGEYPFQPAVDLWRRGFVASFDGRIWKLHTGKLAKIVYEWEPK
jgi:hypothetical protein